MPETPDFAEHAGTALFPRTPADLTSTTQCPACLQVLASIPCANCGLDLGHPLAAELAMVSADAAELLASRVRLIGRIRFDTARAAAATTAPAVAVPESPEPPVASPAAVRPPAAARPPESAVPKAAASARPVEPRRSSVQILLLIVGVSLVSIAAIFFLVYAFINYGLIWRTAIIGAITVAAFVTATLLRRRALVSTAEGIAAFAVVLVYLDAFAVRANDLFSSASSDGLTYWGAALVLSAAGLLAWHRLSGLRVARIAAFTAVAPGAGLLAAGLATPLDDTARVFLGFLAVALAGLAHPLAGPTAPAGAAPASVSLERSIVLAFAGSGLAIAFFLAFLITPEREWGAPVALLGVAVAATAQAAVIVRDAVPTVLLRSFGVGFAAVASLSTGSAAVVASYRLLSFEGGVVASVISTTIVALAAAFWALGIADASAAADAPTPAPLRSAAVRVATLVACGMAVVALAPPVAIALVISASLAVTSVLLRPWRLGPAESLDGSLPFGLDAVSAVTAIAVCIALVGAFAVLTRRVALFRAPLRWAIVTLAILAVPLLAVQWAVLAGWFVLAAAGVVALIRSRADEGAPRLHWAALAIVSGALGYAASWASVDTWLAGSAASIALLLAARLAFRPSFARVPGALSLGVATVLALVAATALARERSFEAAPLEGPFEAVASDPVVDSLRFVSILSVALIVVSAMPFSRLLSSLDRRVLFFLAAIATAITVPAAAVVLALRDAGTALGGAGAGGGPTATLAEPVTSVVLAATLLGGLLAWLLPRANTAGSAERVASAASLALVVAWLLDSVAGAVGTGGEPRQLVPTVAALLVAAGALAATARRAAFPRAAADLGIAVVAATGVLVTVLAGSGIGWMALLLAAVTALLSAISADGLVASSSRRRHLGWLALALATLALWWRLSDASVDTIEAYTLPLAGALLVVALLVWHAERRFPDALDARPSPVPPLLVLAAALVAVLPSAFGSTGGLAVSGDATGRAILIGSLAAVLLLLGSLTRGSSALRPYLDVAAVAGFCGVVIVAVGRGVALTASGFGAPRHDDAWLDTWLAAAVAVLAIASVGQASRRPGDTAWTRRAAQALLLVGIALVLLFESVGFASADLGPVRAVLAPLSFSAVYVVAILVDRMPLTTVVARTALGAAVLAALAGLASGAVDDVEWVAVPIAVALLVTGARRLASSPTVRSWPTLGPGLAILLLPPLLATLSDRPVWRLVAIGVVALAVLVVGLRARLQAPFLVGAVVALVHGIATFAPQIRAVYELTEWWVWAGLGGIVIIVLAALYERSLNAARNVVGSIAGLR